MEVNDIILDKRDNSKNSIVKIWGDGDITLQSENGFIWDATFEYAQENFVIVDGYRATGCPPASDKHGVPGSIPGVSTICKFPNIG